MKVAVLGTGDVGRALALGFATSGHTVTVGSRDRNSPQLRELLEAVGPKATGGTFAEAVATSELVVLATHGVATPEAIRIAGIPAFAGKVVIDATNPLEFHPEGPPSLSVGHSDSLGERIQALLPDAKVVKAFNIVGNPSMFRPEFPGGPPDMWICGNDSGAKATVTGILHEFGWPSVIDLGGIDGARLLEPLCLLWVRSGFAIGNFNIAFRLLRK
jgi:predicted dinucleotide-binding enzyme